MRAFSYEKPTDAAAAATAAAETPGAKFLAGGTNLLDLMKLEIEFAIAVPSALQSGGGRGPSTTTPGSTGALDCARMRRRTRALFLQAGVLSPGQSRCGNPQLAQGGPSAAWSRCAGRS